MIPLPEFKNVKAKNTTPPPTHVKNWLNTRQRLIKKYKQAPNKPIEEKIRSLDLNIKTSLHTHKSNDVRKLIKPSNSKSNWQAVKLAKDKNPDSIPSNLTFSASATPIPAKQIPDAFANFFETKVNTIYNEAKIDQHIYNGKKKLNSTVKFFMADSNILQCIKTIKIKNCEGVDQIQRRILVDRADPWSHPSHTFSNYFIPKKNCQPNGEWLR